MSSSTPASSTTDLASFPADERDAAWLQHYYRGDQPQLTWRAVITGGILGMLMSVSNLYTTLKVGWSFGVAITACILSHAIWKLFAAVRLSRTSMTLLENNCMQSTASAAGSSTGGTLATAVGALLLLGGDGQRLGWMPVAAWVLLVALLGVLLAVPMKRQMINAEQLPFPSGIAAAETLRSLYAAGHESVQKAHALLWSLATGAVVALLRVFGVFVQEIPLGLGLFSIKGVRFTGSVLGMTVEPSLLLVAAGMIVGLRVSCSMLLGSLINYLVLTPYVLSLPDWVEVPKHFIGEMEVVLGQGGELSLVRVTRWSLWVGTAVMVSSGLTSFALGWRTILRAMAQFSRRRAGVSTDVDPVGHLEVPFSWMLIGGIPVALALILLCWFAFGITPWLGLISVMLSLVVALVACRATGETDTTPIGAMGKLTQLIYAVLAPAHLPTNLVTAGVTAGAAGSAADLLTDLKSGYLLGANPRKQFLAQAFGVIFGVVAVVPAWYLLVPTRAALEAFNPPATNMWAAVAAALGRGLHTLPISARSAILAGAIVGIILPLVEMWLPERLRRFVPSAMGLGMAMVVPFANSFAFFLGAAIVAVWFRVHSVSASRFVIPIASGLVAGESLAAAMQAILANWR
ncbi:MAG: OPT family oligopeptide transporter [Myxococcales bacterium]